MSAALGGTIAFTETQLVNGGEATTITLTNDTWTGLGLVSMTVKGVPSIADNSAAFDAIRQDILNGFTSSSSEAGGWNNQVRDAEVVTAVTRIDDVTVQVVWSAAPSFDITANEVITWNGAGSTLTSGVPTVATPPIGVVSDTIATINAVAAKMKVKAGGVLTHPDSSPGAIVFNDEPVIPASTTRTSNEVAITDVDSFASVSIEVSGAGGYKLNGAAPTTSPGVGALADLIALEHQSSGTPSGTASTTLTLDGSVSDTFTSTTEVLATGDVSLAFSDLISGPAIGLGDGLGSGVIVTVWGFGLGSTQGGTSTLTFTDFGGTPYVNGNGSSDLHIYYWKNADGALPGGPANLYESHNMQEICFSIPNCATGAGTIKVTVGGVDTNDLPFTVRTGGIYHVMSGGTGSGTWANPWGTLYDAESAINFSGATVYVHDDIITGTNTTSDTFGINTPGAGSTVADQYSYTAYPSSQPIVRSSGKAFNMTATTGMVVSKFTVEASNYLVGANGQLISQRDDKNGCIMASKNSRIIGNRCTDTSDGCASQFQGAIFNDSLQGDTIGNTRILGNEVHDYGCEGSGKLHHTTYLSMRDELSEVYDPPEVGWNYLHDNWAKNGIHFFDQDLHSDWGGPIHIHDNVITGQGGSGIFIGDTGTNGWTNDWYVYNNIVINTALASQWNGEDPETSSSPVTTAISAGFHKLEGTIYVFNNTIYKWNDDDLSKGAKSAIGTQDTNTITLVYTNNICLTDKDLAYYGHGGGGQDNSVKSGSHNNYYTSAGTQNNAVPPTFTTNDITTDPLLTFNNGGAGPQITAIGGASDIIGGGTAPPISVPRDIYGKIRVGNDVGAVQS